MNLGPLHHFLRRISGRKSQECPYLNKTFLKKLEEIQPRMILELGSCDGRDGISVASHFPNARVLSFECNPRAIGFNRENIVRSKLGNIRLFEYAVGDKNAEVPFFPFPGQHMAASSLYRSVARPDCQSKVPIFVKMIRLDSFLDAHQIEKIDLLLMDLQGSEIYALRGMGSYLSSVKLILMETTKSQPSFYGAPNGEEIKKEMNELGFVEVARVYECKWDDNVLYKKREE